MTELQFAPGYKNRRFQNWFFMGLAYAFLYWGRYNLTVAKTSLGGLMTKPTSASSSARGPSSTHFLSLLTAR